MKKENDHSNVNRSRPLLLVGNKRSGTSLLVELLNQHSGIYVAYEADLIWLLYQMGQRYRFESYGDDGPKGMERTLARYGPLFLGPGNPRELFFQVLGQIQSCDIPLKPTSVAWAGDKKPVQHVDPRLRSFIHKHFPDAKFLHIIRHPTAVVGSMFETRRHMPWMEVWNKTPDKLLAFWVRNEQRVLDLKHERPGRVLSVRYEDLCVNGAKFAQEVCSFLEIESASDLVSKCVTTCRKGVNEKYRGWPLTLSDNAMKIIEKYELVL
jgi:hypothetical protein